MKVLGLRMGLRWQLVLLFLLVSLIPLLIVAYLAHWYGTRGLTGAIESRLIELAQDRVDLADRVIADQLRPIRRLQLRSISQKSCTHQ